MTWYSKTNILKRTNVLIKMDVLYESMKWINESELSSSRLRIYAETGSTRKNISIPETLWVIDNKADNGSWILNKLM